MKVWLLSVGVAGLTLTLAVTSPAPVAAAQCAAPPVPPTCVATAEHPVAICFAAPPLTVDHCGPEIAPNFTIDLWHAPETATVGYRYSYQLIANGHVGRVERFGDPDDPATYPFTETPDLTGRRLMFSGRGVYALRVTVSRDGQPDYAEPSADVLLDDKPRIRGLSVGISHYANPSFNLNYADTDAKAFQGALTMLLADNADVTIDRRTSDEGDDMGKDALIAMIQKVANDAEQDPPASALSGPDDWYVFYFSGHGVVGVNRQGEVGRYISTQQFDPDNLMRTSIRVTDLAHELDKTGARNLLVILDSCFSGFHLNSEPVSSGSGRGLRAPAAPHTARLSGKVMYVANGKVVGYQIPGNADAKAFVNKLRDLEEHDRRGLVLAASSADREAEEGSVSYTRRNDRTILVFERSIGESKAAKAGHGLFTFALLANLLAQLPAGTDISALLPGAKTPDGQRDCWLNFGSAATDAVSDIDKLGDQYQKPEVQKTQSLPPRMACTATVR
jgi:Caspase domain